ncbi:MAG: SDR family NAD(P)-dependent oxidoreductase [Pseudomonadota bacterium]
MTDARSQHAEVAPAHHVEGRLAGRHALITGSANGIGRAMAHRFVAEGALVWVSDREMSATEAAAEAINTELAATPAGSPAPGTAIPVACDVTRSQDVTQVFRTIADTHGRLDIVINNAGLNVRGDFRHMSNQDWETIREVNLDGVVRLARDGFELLRASEHASLINVASIMGHRGLRQLTGYSATKGAVSALTRGLAVEYAPFGIRVNAIAPGFVETALTDRVLRNPMISKALLDQTPLRRFGSPEDIAGAAVFLASDDARFITGAELAVDGGMSAGL